MLTWIYLGITAGGTKATTGAGSPMEGQATAALIGVLQLENTPVNFSSVFALAAPGQRCSDLVLKPFEAGRLDVAPGN
jgi:hypothetical protein